MPETNPFFARSTLPFELPPFESIGDRHYRPAFDHGMRQQLREIEAITEEDAAATFENTLVPLERSGQILDRVSSVFFTLTSAASTDFTTALEEEIAPRLAAHSDAILLNSRLYARVRTVYDARDTLDDASRYLVERCFSEFTRAGAALGDEDKAQLREYNQRISILSTRCEKNLLADSNDLAVVVDDVHELDGLSSGEISAAAAAAHERGLDGKFVVSLVLPTGHPYLASLTRRELRERIMRASRSRGASGGVNDNRALVAELAQLRAKRARLLGFDSHAAYVTADETAHTPHAVASLLNRLAPIAARNAQSELDVLRTLNDAPRDFASWDWAFFSETVRSTTYSVDRAALHPYFESERVLRDGVFYAAERLYGVTFSERDDLAAYHPDVRVFEVTDHDGSPIGLYLLDLYTRDSKRGGAWMNSLVEQSFLLDSPTVVLNNLNVPKPTEGEVTLLSFDEVNTLFHEFGHALHGLFARVTYPRFSGTNVHRDFVEFPSQVNEMWMLWPEVLANYAVHYETEERLPQSVVDRLLAASTFNEGFATSEYLAAALLDQAWHTLTPDDEVVDVESFETQALAAAGLDNPAIPPRYSTPYFAHTFSGGYDAGYYSYIWSEVLDADTVEWFTQNGGLTRDNGDRFRALVLGVGGSQDPLEAYRAFRGRDAVIEPLLKRRGLN